MEAYGNIALGIGMSLTAFMSLLTYLKAHKTENSMALLEMNTNSIKDALVKVTGEAEHAKGVLQGKKELDG